MSNNGTLEFDVKLNPDASKIDQALGELQAKQQAGATQATAEASKKIELEKGQVEGFLEEIQKFSARLANGGISKGFEQIKSGVKTFQDGLKNGKDVTTSAAEGLSMLGVEAQAVGTAVMSAATVVVAAVVAFVELETAAIEAADAMQRQQRDIAALQVNYSQFRDQVKGVVDIQQALAVQNIAIANGQKLTASQLASVTNSIRDWSIATGDANGASQLWTQALAGNIEAARQLGLVVSDYSTKQQVMQQVLQASQQQASSVGNVTSTLGEVFQTFKNEIGEVWDAIKVVFGGSLAVVMAPFIAAFVGSIKLAAEGVRALKNGLDSLGLTNFAQQQAAIDAQRAQAAQNLALAEQNRVSIMQTEDRLKQSSFATTQLELRALSQAVSFQERMSELNRQELDINNAIATLSGLTFRTEQDRLANQERINNLQQRLIGIGRERNNQYTIQAQMERTTQANLIAQARSQAGVTSEHVRQRTLSEQINEAVALRNRLLRVSQLIGHELTEQEKKDLANAQTLINQNREQQRQAAIQLQDSLLQLQIQNEIARATGGQVNNRIRELDLAERLRVTEERASRINLSGNSQQAIDSYNRLTQQANSLRDALEQIRTASDNALNPFEKALERMASMSSVEDFGGILDNIANSQSGYFDAQREGASLDRQRALSLAELTQAALEAEFAGQTLTQSQISSLNSLQQAYVAVEQQQAATATRIREIQDILANPLIGEQQKNELRREYNDLVQQQIGLEQRVVDIQRAQNGPGALEQIKAAVRSLSGEYRSFGSVAGGIAAQGLTTLGGAFKSHLAAVITGKETIGQALQAMLHETMLSLAQESAVKALFNTAEGIAAFASGNIGKGTQHMIAAGTYGAVAIATGAVAAATVPTVNSSAPAGSSGASRTASSTQEVPQQQEGPITVNINGALLSEEQVEDAVYAGVTAAQNRRGRRR